MLYEHKIEGCFSSSVGSEGLDKASFTQSASVAHHALLKLKNLQENRKLPLFSLPFARQDLTDISPLVSRFRDEFSDIIILGTGGSSLGGQTLTALSTHSHPRLHFMDNIDPHTFTVLLSSLELKNTGVIAISKSGSTAETMVQLLTCLEHWRYSFSEGAWSQHFLVITEKKSSPLFRLAQKFQIPFIEHDPLLGGRFSIFSLVGLFPGMLVHIDPISFREGAAFVLERMASCADVLNFEPAIGALIAYSLATEKKKTLSVFMPYCDRLQFFSKWYCQLWAESLGKEGRGTTPIDALGSVDQHSQLQLYLDGPRDKFFTILTTECAHQGGGVLEPLWVDDVDLRYLSNKRLGDLMAAEQEATIQTLIKRQCPTRVIHAPSITTEVLGALAMHFVLETLFMAEILSVDPFNQPAVEEGKILAKQYLSERF